MQPACPLLAEAVVRLAVEVVRGWHIAAQIKSTTCPQLA